MMTIGEKIAMLRKERNITQTQLAEYLHLVPQTISKWEVGNGTPEISLLPGIAAFFGVSIDDLFGVSSLAHAWDVVMKYSVLRDDKSFQEAEECLKSQIQTIDASLDREMGDREGLELERIELEGLQMHLLLQQSWESAKRALEIAESLIQRTQKMPYRLQRLQLRSMLGYSRRDLLECEAAFREAPGVDTLQVYFEMLSLVQNYEKLLDLYHTDRDVAALMRPASEGNVKLWVQCASAARQLKDLELTESCGEAVMKYGTADDRYELLWNLAVLYKEKGMDQKGMEAKEQLRSLLKELAVNSYWYEHNRHAIEQL